MHECGRVNHRDAEDAERNVSLRPITFQSDRGGVCAKVAYRLSLRVPPPPPFLLLPLLAVYMWRGETGRRGGKGRRRRGKKGGELSHAEDGFDSGFRMRGARRRREDQLEDGAEEYLTSNMDTTGSQR